MPSLDDVRERWRELQAPGAVEALAQACAARVVEHVYMEMHSRAHRPAPSPRAWRRLDAPAERMTRVGVDADGRPTIAETVHGEDVWGRDLLTWTDTSVELVELRDDALRKLEVTVFDGPRAVETIECDGMTRLDGRVSVGLTRYDYGAHDLPELALDVYESGAHRSWGPEPHWRWRAMRSLRARDGTTLLESIVPDDEQSQVAFGGDHEAALAEARAALAAGRWAARVMWDGRLLTPESDIPEPEVAFAGLAAPLADALVLARAGAGRVAFLDVIVSPFTDGDRASFIRAAAAGPDFRDRARAAVTEPGEVLALAHAETASTAKLDVLAAATPELLRRIRQALQASAPERLVSAFAVELARVLDARDWGEVEPGFLALVRRPRPELEAPSRTALGDQRVSAFMRTLTPASRPRRSAHVPDRAALASYLREQGLSSAEAERAAADAAWGIVLDSRGGGESRIGGRPVLPEAMPWPATGDKRPLSHLATIALAELPEVEGRDVLPAGGHLAFFADLSEEGELVEPIEPDGEGRDRVAVVHPPAGAPAHEPAPPDPEIALEEERVTPAARLQLRYVGGGFAMYKLGLDAVAEHVLSRVVWAVNGNRPEQLLGYPQVVQEDPRKDGDVAVLHLGDDALGGFLDAGDLLFYGATEDVRAGRWDRLTVSPSSC
jgi:hypothetical protein